MESDVKGIDVKEKEMYSPRYYWRSRYHMRDTVQAKKWMTTTEATSYLGVSSKTMARLIRDGVIRTHNHPLDRRKKLVRFIAIARLKEAADRVAA